MSTKCIYEIVGKNGRTYYGSTNNLEKRKKYHFRDLRLNRHYNPILQRAYNKYGPGHFICNVVEKVEDPGKLLYLEQKYLDAIFSGPEKMRYNLNRIAGKPPSWHGKNHSDKTKRKMSALQVGGNNSMYGRFHSDETKTKMSAAHSGENNAFFGKKHSAETRKKISQRQPKKPVIRVCQKTGEEKHYSYVNAVINDGFSASCVVKVCKQERKSHEGFWWRYS